MLYVNERANLGGVKSIMCFTWIRRALTRRTTAGLVTLILLKSARHGLYAKSLSGVYGPVTIHIEKGVSAVPDSIFALGNARANGDGPRGGSYRLSISY